MYFSYSYVAAMEMFTVEHYHGYMSHNILPMTAKLGCSSRVAFRKIGYEEHKLSVEIWRGG